MRRPARLLLSALLLLALLLGVRALWPGEAEDGLPTADGFDFPVGAPDARGYYDAQPFGENTHLGNDWNGVGGGDTDLGDPVYSVADGVVSFSAEVGGGWGQVVRILHRVGDGDRAWTVESLYAHFDQVFVREGQRVKRGMVIGAIGTANGRYRAHLHFELRGQPHLPLGGGYGTATSGYLDPTAFIRGRRPVR
jgi:murein DD-endopeptidase MepM/ murein hydrolase activator NlpD